LAAQKKHKKLTNREKQDNKRFREELRQKGIIPPIKPKLNRKKFAKEVIEEYENTYIDLEYLCKAIACMLPGEFGKVTPEQVGVVKVLKLAMEIKRFTEEKISQGETTYKVMEMYKEVVAPVLDL